MTSAEASSPPTAIASDAPALHSQASQIPIDPSTVNVDNRENVETTPTRSLFGPFPPSQEPSQADRHTADISEVKEVPISPPSDQIESSSKDEQAANQPNLNFNPHSQESSSPIQTNKSSGINNESLPPLLREKTAPAIGPATDKPTPVPKESEMEGPVLYITLLLSSTGARHPYKLDEKYLRKRNVVVDANNPINISLYKLKELILRDWREGENEFRVTQWCCLENA